MKVTTRADRLYKEKRTELVKRLAPRELWEIADHWPLYSGVGNLARQIAISDLVRASIDVPGHVAEFGVWRGATTMLTSKLLRIFDPMGAKVVHAFDSFEGLGAFSAPDGHATEKAGHYRGSLEELRAFIELYDLDDTVDLHVGLIEQTLPELLEARPELGFSLVYCDTDLYASTGVILDALHPRLSKGGVFVLDEWNHPQYPGESVAVAEFMARHGASYEPVAPRATRQPSLVLRKIA